MKKCPCCDKMSMQDDEILNSLSHIDNKTYICNICGQNESFIGINPSMVEPIDIDIHERFKKRLEK